MAVSAAFADFVADLFAPLGAVRVKRMFGGAGVYCGAVMFALIADDVLYLKADEETRARFRREGMAPFTYVGRDGREMAMSYYALPERLYDEPEEALAWAREALSRATIRTRSNKERAKRTPKRR
jgi:DNA transformation protein